MATNYRLPMANGDSPAQRNGYSIWRVQDKIGNPTNSAQWSERRWALAAFLGGDREARLSQRICAWINRRYLFSSTPAANYGPWVRAFCCFLEAGSHPVGEGIGHFSGQMRE